MQRSLPKTLISLILVLFGYFKFAYPLSIGETVSSPYDDKDLYNKWLNGDSDLQTSTSNSISRIFKRNSYQLCGSRLVLTLNFICNGQMHVPVFHRRSDPSMNGEYLEETVEVREPNSNSIDVRSDQGRLPKYYWTTRGAAFDDNLENSEVTETELPQRLQYRDEYDKINYQNPKSSTMVLNLLGGSSSNGGDRENHQNHQRVRRSIIDECCKKPCTRKQIGKYCGRSASPTTRGPTLI